MNSYDMLLQSVSAIARKLQELQALAGLLDFCGHEPVLRLSRTLCRHYFAIDPAAAVGYIDAYRELWDDGETEGWE